VKALTWPRDSHGLFDYENFQNIRNTLKIEGNCVLARSESAVKVVTESEHIEALPSPGGERMTKLAACTSSNGSSYFDP
jgi:hypothetical protein